MKKTFLNIFKQSWPYMLAFYVGNKVLQAFSIVQSDDIAVKIQYLDRALPLAFANPLPSFGQQALLGGAVGVFIVFFVVQNAKGKKKKMRDGEEHGSAAWGTQEELAPLVDPEFSKNIILSETERIRMTPMPPGMWQRTVNKNILVVGGSGSGKTSSFVKPGLLQYDSHLKGCAVSYVITDPKGSVLLECGKMLSKSHKIKFLDLIEMDKSMKFNPLAYVKSDKDVRKLVTTLMVNTKSEGTGGDSFFEDSASIVLTALISYVCSEAAPEERNLNTVLDMLNAIELRDDPEYKCAVDILMENLEKKHHEQGNPTPFCVKQYRKFQQAGMKTGQSILATVNAHVAPLELPEVQELISRDELGLDTLGDDLNALFIIVSDTDTSMNFIAAILYTLMFDLLCDKAKKYPKGRLPVHVRCILDEFANIGKIPNFQVLVSTIRSREISVCPILQTKSQLKALYDKHAETISGCCDTHLFLGGREESTVKEIADILGRQTLDARSTSENSGRDKSYGQSYQRIGRDLMSKDEIASMPGDRCIVQIKGCRPFYSKKYNLTKHPNYRLLSDSNSKNEFDVEKYLASLGRVKAKKSDIIDVYEIA